MTHASGQTNKQTNKHIDTLIAIHCYLPGRSNSLLLPILLLLLLLIIIIIIIIII